MIKAYPSNLTQDQFELLNDLIPDPKPGGRPREVDMWEILNAIFYILCEGCRWRALRARLPRLADGVYILSQLAERWNLGQDT